MPDSSVNIAVGDVIAMHVLIYHWIQFLTTVFVFDFKVAEVDQSSDTYVSSYM